MIRSVSPWVALFLVGAALQASTLSAQTSPVDRQGDPLPPGAIARLGTVRLRHGGRVDSVAFSPDGRWLCSAGGDYVIRIWDTRTGKEVLTLAGQDLLPTSVAFDREGSRIACGGPNLVGLLWDLKGLGSAATEEVPQASPSRRVSNCGSRVFFSPQGTLLSVHGSQSIYEPNGREPWLKLPDDSITVAVSADGSQVAAGGRDGSLFLADIAAGATGRAFAAHRECVVALAWSVDREYLASADQHGEVILWEVSQRRVVRQWTAAAQRIASMAVAPGGKLVAIGGSAGEIQAWTPDANEPLWMNQILAGPVDSLSISPNGRSLAAGGSDGSLLLLEASTGRELLAFEGHRSPIESIAFRAGDQVLVATGSAVGIAEWAVPSAKPSKPLPVDRSGGKPALLSPDGMQWVRATREGTSLVVIDTTSSRESQVLKGSDARVERIAFDADGHRLVTASRDGLLRVWDVTTGICISTIDTASQSRRRTPQTDGAGSDPDTHGGGARYEPVISSVALSADGRWVASGRGGSIAVWDSRSGERTAFLDVHANVGLLCFSPDGKTVAAGGGFLKRVCGWEWQTGGDRYAQCTPLSIQSLRFSIDGRLLAVGGRDGKIRMWDSASGQETALFDGHRGPVCALTFSTDGLLLASGSVDTTVLLWDLRNPIADDRKERHATEK